MERELSLTREILADLPKNGRTDPIEYYRRPLVGWLFLRLSWVLYSWSVLSLLRLRRRRRGRRRGSWPAASSRPLRRHVWQ